MGSGEAKKFRQMYGSAGRHGESFWEEEKSNVGLKLLKSMGWENGQGLGKRGEGRTDTVKQFRKNDNAGIGANAATRDETFRASQELFNGILARLSGKTDPADAAEEAGLGGGASTVKGMMAKRQLTHRFRRAKDTANCDQSALNAIFGRSSDAPTSAQNTKDAPAKTGIPEGQHTSSVTVSDYFARKRQELGLAPSIGAGSSGFTLDDQTRFAETQASMAYSGRFGLGHTSGSSASVRELPSMRASALQTFQALSPPPQLATPGTGSNAPSDTEIAKTKRLEDNAEQDTANTSVAGKRRKRDENGQEGRKKKKEKTATKELNTQLGGKEKKLSKEARRAAKQAAKKADSTPPLTEKSTAKAAARVEKKKKKKEKKVKAKEKRIH